MVKTQPRYERTRNIFLVLFLLSTLVFVCLFLGFGFSLQAGPGTITDTATTITLIGAVASCLTSIVTFVGLVSTMVLAWRKESRDAKIAELESKHKEIEIEKESLELEKLKAEQQKRQKEN